MVNNSSISMGLFLRATALSVFDAMVETDGPSRESEPACHRWWSVGLYVVDFVLILEIDTRCSSIVRRPNT